MSKREENYFRTLVLKKIEWLRVLNTVDINNIVRNKACNHPELTTFLNNNAGFFSHLTPLKKSEIISNALNQSESLRHALKESNEANVQSMEFALPETAAITADDMINCLLPAVKDILKSHQRDGIKFFFQRIIVEKSGAILAHNMGLGKTLTTLAFLYATLELYKKQILKVIIVVPVGVLRQWNQEYEKWFGNSSSIFVMDEKPSTRINTIFEWISDAEKNIMIIGYTKFVDVMHDVNGATALQSINLIVFDEAHKMKTETTNVYKIAEMVTTPLKIFLSGTPLQNNVMEYYNMMQLISPNILCDREEFKISYLKPIEDGKTKDAPQCAIDLRKERCRQIFDVTRNIMDRRTAAVLFKVDTPFNEIGIEKLEVTLLLRATEVQKKIIEHYLTSGIKVALVDRNCITYILNHPAIYMKMQDMAVNEKVHNDFEMSNKIILLLEMIKYCESVGDKLLVFTSSIATLKYIEYVLSFMKSTWFTDGHTAKTNLLRDQWSWEKGEDFEIIDGTTKSVDRLKIQNNFKQSPRFRLMLFSTIAGSLGTNFDSANRVVIFDPCWNPSHDIQSLFRVCRLGQKKKVIVYRFVTEETMEKVIYNRQLTKEATQGRVLDDLNYENKFTKEQLANLYPSTGIYENTEKDPENLSERDPFLLSIIKGHPGAIQEIRSHPSYFNEDDELEDETFEDDDSDFETFAL